MEWSESTLEAMQRWLAPGTWHKTHPLDDGRFCLFVASVWNDEHKLWDEPVARERIRNEAIRLHPGCDDLAAEVAKRRVSEGSEILDFLAHLREDDRFGLLTL